MRNNMFDHRNLDNLVASFKLFSRQPLLWVSCFQQPAGRSSGVATTPVPPPCCRLFEWWSWLGVSSVSMSSPPLYPAPHTTQQCPNICDSSNISMIDYWMLSIFLFMVFFDKISDLFVSPYFFLPNKMFSHLCKPQGRLWPAHPNPARIDQISAPSHVGPWILMPRAFPLMLAPHSASSP